MEDDGRLQRLVLRAVSEFEPARRPDFHEVTFLRAGPCKSCKSSTAGWFSVQYLSLNLHSGPDAASSAAYTGQQQSSVLSSAIPELEPAQQLDFHELGFHGPSATARWSGCCIRA